ncbi:glycoside hydrolase family 2 TIM barrel-domain containing protein [Spirosoma sp. KNUC1025]|uniref:glycoside hydrolase family 2 TIM barrel-domain containing protein n=1 Tax=Spirosoma sp. KNUC1025 TaxID=2894082 RepID=UPI00386AAF40|nr:hypothetical protein LN737_29605 [Spirosoma sp. KNUC1025]
MRNGKPFFIKGAGGFNQFKRLKEAGGNSIRIWEDHDAARILDQAQALGLTVMFGLWVERDLDGFDYYDEEAVAKQFERIRKIIVKYRNHPALLMWCVGNEWNLRAKNIGVYDEVNRIASMIHELDPHHPITTAIGTTQARTIWLIKDRCPAIDIISFNVYGALYQLSDVLKEADWTGPYMLSEFGTLGHWESRVARWQAPIELPWQNKIDFIKKNYLKYIGSQPPNCLGAYMFYWGNKEEGTHTWYSFFDAEGNETPFVETMQQLWSGRLPKNLAPEVGKIEVDGIDSTYRSFPASATLHQARITASDPEKDSLSYYWEIRPQAALINQYDYMDVSLMPTEGLIASAKRPETSFRLPSVAGQYRLFVYVYDGHKHVTSANIPFLVGRRVQ